MPPHAEVKQLLQNQDMAILGVRKVDLFFGDVSGKISSNASQALRCSHKSQLDRKSLLMKPDAKIISSPRPLRVAYVLEEGVDGHKWLDAIFANSFGRHGGRQSLVIPVIEGQIPDRYMNWLQLIDPDFVLLLTFDNQKFLEPLTRILGDTKIQERFRSRGDEEEHPRVDIDINGLSSISWIPFLKVTSSAMRAAPEFILDRFPGWNDDGIIKDNFGTPFGSLNPFPMHDQLGVPALILTPPDAPKNRWHFQSIEGEEIQNAYSVIERLANTGNIATLSRLSNLAVQRFQTSHSWNNSFCLVIGDSFADRISCWNSALLFGNAETQELHSMRIPAHVVSDINKIDKISHYLNRRNWINQQGGQGRVTIRSHSLSTAQLQNFADQLKTKSYSWIEISPISSLDECCPVDKTQVHPTGSGWSNNHDKRIETKVIDGVTVISPAKPFHLSYCSGQHPVFSQGSWYVDLSIDRLSDNGRYSNVREEWRLPIRTNLIRKFCSGNGARLLSYGSITKPIDNQETDIKINTVSDMDIIHSLLTEMPIFDRDDMRHSIQKKPAYCYIKPSDKGSYLRGLIGLFGSLNDAERTLENHFWRNQFLKMAVPSQNQKDEIITYLKRRLKARNSPLVINDDGDWQRLAHRIIEKSFRLRAPKDKTKFDKLLSAWLSELEQGIMLDQNLAPRLDEILGEARNELERSLSYLFGKGIFFRGHAWSCRHCSNRNWVAVDSLKDIMACEVCKREHQLPVDVSLDFRLNDFFATCLREHDTLAVTWALSSLRQESKHSFIYSPQINLYKDYPENQKGQSNRELDVVCIIDNKFVIGEVKISVDIIADSDIEDLADAAIKLDVDKAVLMALSGEISSMDDKVAKLRKLLPDHIGAYGKISDWNDSPSVFL